ncbi:14597_t:CDS:2 [Entrophospora sp. SA101]|nr:14597_t:CDS:2 [Entrophospora sp. SA101]
MAYYDSNQLTWNDQHTINEEQQYCYCRGDRNLSEVSLQCSGCFNWFHEKCIKISVDKTLPIFTNYKFVCKWCNGTDTENFKRTQAGWKEIGGCAIANLMLQQHMSEHRAARGDCRYNSSFSKKLSQFNYYFNKNDHLRPFVDKNWSSLCTERSRTATWWATLGSCLYSTKDIFVAKDENNRSASSNFCLMDPNLWNIKPGCFGSTHSRIPSRAVKETINNRNLPRSSSTEFGQSGEQNNLRNGFKYLPCKSDKLFSYTQYRNSELRPYGVRLSKEDASLSVWISGDQLTTTTDHGFSMARANCPVKEGKWFYEVFIDRGGEGKVDGKDGAHVRVGWARREGNRNSPVGSDGYSYGIRDLTGQKVHMSHVKKFGEPFKTGDVIGIYISLPPLKKVSKGYKYKAPKRQRIPILFKGETIFEYKDFKPTQPELPTLPGSKIIVYKNGICQGIAFENLFSFFPIIDKYTADDDLIEDDGSLGYYPAVSMFREKLISSKKKIEICKWKPMSERYMEYVAEDVVYDIVDEIELWDWMRGQNKNKASMVNKRPYSAILANNNNNSQEFSDGNSKKFKQEKQEPKIEEEYDDSKYLAQDWDLFI